MKLYFIGLVVLIASTLSSCKNCVDCTGVAGVSGQQYQHYCKTDYIKQTKSEEGWSSFSNALKASGCKGVN